MCVSTLVGAGGEVKGIGAVQVITQTAWETLLPFLSTYCESRWQGAPRSVAFNPFPIYYVSAFGRPAPPQMLTPPPSPGAGWRPGG